MTPESWLSAAVVDAKRRGLPELEPLLATMARSMAALRRADDDQRREERAGAADERER